METTEDKMDSLPLEIDYDFLMDLRVDYAFKDEEEIQMAVTALARQSKDKIARQAYQRRKDELFYYNKNMSERDDYKLRAEVAESALAEKDAALDEQAKIIAELRSQLDKK